jgi:hypothetical protein
MVCDVCEQDMKIVPSCIRETIPVHGKKLDPVPLRLGNPDPGHISPAQSHAPRIDGHGSAKGNADEFLASLGPMHERCRPSPPVRNSQTFEETVKGPQRSQVVTVNYHSALSGFACTVTLGGASGSFSGTCGLLSKCSIGGNFQGIGSLANSKRPSAGAGAC